MLIYYGNSAFVIGNNKVMTLSAYQNVSAGTLPIPRCESTLGRYRFNLEQGNLVRKGII